MAYSEAKKKARAAELGISVNTYMIELIKKDLEET